MVDDLILLFVAINYVDLSNPIDVPMSHHEGRLTGK
jgi:hypothetical protein